MSSALNPQTLSHCTCMGSAPSSAQQPEPYTITQALRMLHPDPTHTPPWTAQQPRPWPLVSMAPHPACSQPPDLPGSNKGGNRLARRVQRHLEGGFDDLHALPPSTRYTPSSAASA